MSEPQKSTSSVWRPLFVFLNVAVVTAAGIFIWAVAFNVTFVPKTINYVVYELASRSGVSSFYVRGVVILVSIPFFYAVARFTKDLFGLLQLKSSPLALYKDKFGIVIVLYVGLFWLAMGAASERAGPYKNCARRPDQQLFWSDDAGKDPEYGVPYHPCSFDEITEMLSTKRKLPGPQPLEIEDAYTTEWFNGNIGLKGPPRIWYVQDDNGKFRYFDRPGSDPILGVPLKPVTPEVVQHAEHMQDESRRQAAELEAIAAKRAIAAQERAKAASKTQAQNEQRAEIISTAGGALSAGNYDLALQGCAEVFKSAPHDQQCKSIYEEAGPKEANILVQQSLREVQQNKLDDALLHADRAMKLDPENQAAKKIKALAQGLKQTSATLY